MLNKSGMFYVLYQRYATISLFPLKSDKNVNIIKSSENV